MKTSDENVLGSAIVSDSRSPSARVSFQNEHSSSMPSDAYPYAREMAAKQIENEVIELLHRHAAALSRYAARIVRDKAVAQDSVQEAFLRYFISRVGGQQIENPCAWLFRVVANYLTDCIRKSSSMPAADLKAAAQVSDPRQDVEAGYQQNEAFKLALASLSPRERECMQLRLEGFGYDEIARILRVRPGTVGAMLDRGLKKIRKIGLLPGRQR
jgi:RNA polymerase sigma-70 factor (ECF subfamily)